ncbi:MAG: ssrA-binding protein [Parcubacteria group bacterium Gr01-1014_20]|nr:MAG: ssrA-binding protein [Parcubacteria group bacterium Gr01-1014_20]
MKVISENRRARFDYEVLENFEAGIELSGQEVKSAKSGKLNLSASYAVIKKGEVWLLNSEIPAYQPKNAPIDYDSKRTRRLLLRSPEIKSLMGRLNEKGLALVALNAHLKKNLIKIDLGLARSRKKHDKREALKKKAIERETRSR